MVTFRALPSAVSHSGELLFRLLFSQYLFQIPCTRFCKCHNLQVLQHLELKFGLWKEKTRIHVRFLLAAVIIQDIGLPLDSKQWGTAGGSATFAVPFTNVLNIVCASNNSENINCQVTSINNTGFSTNRSYQCKWIAIGVG